jgi:nucleotide-binding universal stress UspA family protein
MAHMQLGRPNKWLLKVASGLADLLEASIIGVAVYRPHPIPYGDYYLGAAALNRCDFAKELFDAETEFRAGLQMQTERLEWRSAETSAPLSDFLAMQVRAADLLITSAYQNEKQFDPSCDVNLRDLVMDLGRPVMITPVTDRKINLTRILIGWKDTREARRAVLDALPLLRKAEHVFICEVAPADNLDAARAHLSDVMAWLKKSDIEAEHVASPSTGDDAATLFDVANEQAADVIVAGAYGHGRLHDWLGSVTESLLLQSDRCLFLSR